MSVILETRKVGKAYGSFRALDDVSILIREGERLSIVGPNGAGKTTLVNLLTGLLTPSEGEVFFKNENIHGADPVDLAERGLARAFQLVHVFPKLTVGETIAAAIVTKQKKRWSMFSGFLNSRETRSRVREIAEIFGLQSRLEAPSQLLSQGEKKLLDVASAFALVPQVILLDEPTSGISTSDKHRVMKTLIAAGEKAGVKAMILIEHDMDLVATYSDRIVALAEGRMLANLPPKEFFANPTVVETVVGKLRTA